MRTARVAGLVSLALVGVFLSAVTASAASVSISKFKVTPAHASGGGSSVTFKAKTKHATSCRLKSSPDIKGVPARLSCKDGSARKVLKIPANPASKARKIVFTLIARHGSLRVRAHVTVNQDPALAAITSLTRTPATAHTDSSTAVKVSAKVTHAKTCTLSSAPAISGLPASASCTSGSFAKTATVPANPTVSARTFTLTLSAKNSIGKITKKSVKVTQAAETAPPSVGLSPTPDALTADGGPLTLQTTVAHATKCTLTSSPSVGALTCANGTVNHAVSIPGNSSDGSKSYAFTLRASNPLGTASTTLTMVQPPHTGPVAIPSISLSPASLTAGGGPVTVHATVSGATACTLTTSTTGHAGTPTGVPCSSGTISKQVTIPPNTGSTPIHYTFHLAASGPGGSATSDLDIDQPAPQVAPPAVTAISSNPTTLTSAGGPITVSATLTGGQTCTWSSSPSAGSAAGAACTTSSSNPFTVPANRGTSAITYTFTLTVTGPSGGHASATLTRTVPPAIASGPQVNSITPNPTSLTPSSTLLTVTAAVTNATTCSITSSPSVGSVTGAACTGGSVSEQFTIPANTTGSDRPYTFTITANGTGGASATGTLTMTQPAATPPAPRVVSMATNPSSLGSAGGDPSVSATVTNATSCTLTVGGDDGASVTSGGSCSGGSYTGGVVHIPQNNGPGTKTVTITVGVTGPGGTASGTLTFQLPPPSGP